MQLFIALPTRDASKQSKNPFTQVESNYYRPFNFDNLFFRSTRRSRPGLSLAQLTDALFLLSKFPD